MDIKVAVGVPHTGMVHAKFAMSLAQVLAYSTVTGIPTMLIDQKTSLIQKGRHEIVAKALEMDASHVLFLDSDMVFPMSIIEILLSHKTEIVGCDYRRTVPPHENTAKGKTKVKTMSGATAVTMLGTGCLLIDIDVFRSLGEPYFKSEWTAASGWQSEDYNFCLRASLLGYTVYCDYDASKEIIHIGQEGYMV